MGIWLSVGENIDERAFCRICLSLRYFAPEDQRVFCEIDENDSHPTASTAVTKGKKFTDRGSSSSPSSSHISSCLPVSTSSEPSALSPADSSPTVKVLSPFSRFPHSLPLASTFTRTLSRITASSMSTYPTIKFSDGKEAPGLAFGIGTAWFKQDCVETVKTALQAGYKSLDLAQAYQNTQSVGKALKESGVDPKSLYSKFSQLILFPFSSADDLAICAFSLIVTSKAGAGMKDVKKAIDEELEALGTDSIDLWLLHWPTDFGKPEFPSMEDAWKAMVEVKESGKAKSIGVSNFRVRDLQKIIDSKPKELPVINQIEYHPYVYEASTELYDFCTSSTSLEPHSSSRKTKLTCRYPPLGAKHDIRLAAYGPTTPITKFSGVSQEFNEELEQVTKAVSKRSGQTAQSSQVLLKLASQQGCLVVTTSGKDWRMKEQLAAGGLPDLTQDEIANLVKSAKPAPQRAFMKHMDDKDTEY